MVRTLAVNFTGVQEGDDFDFGSIEATFAYSYKPIDLYYDDEEEVCFRHFVKPSSSRNPKHGYGILDSQLIDNLDKMNVFTMRPIQIASFMASFFNLPDGPTSSEPDFLGVSSTGSGKTHAFLVPMIQKCLNRVEENPIQKRRTPLVLIFAHSTSLVINIYQNALKLVEGTNVKVQLITGGQDSVKDPYFDIGICTIGRFLSHLDSNDQRYVNISLDDLKYLVIDEADKLVETEEFCRFYQDIECDEISFTTMLFTATANIALKGYFDPKNFYAFAYGKPNKVADSVKQYFWRVDTRRDSKIVGTSTGKTFMYDYAPTEIPHPFDALYVFVKNILYKKPGNKKVIVFVKRTCVADMIALRLRIYGYDSISVHGNQPPETRQRYLERFISGQERILLATQLLTRGTDIHVDYVINYDLPGDYTDFVHRSGRTGRNGQIGSAITFVDFNNKEDYGPFVLRQIVLNTDNKLFPEFMRDYGKEVEAIIEEEKRMVAQQFAPNENEDNACIDDFYSK